MPDTAPAAPAEIAGQEIDAETPQETEEPFRPFRFRRFLPIAQLFLCAVLLWPFRGWIAYDLFGVIIHVGTPHNGIVIDGDSGLPMKPSPELDQWWGRQDQTMSLVAVFNLPGGVVQLPLELLTDGDKIWTPGGTDFKTWMAVSWPLLALPFWWMAGRGLEACIAARRKIIFPRMRWTEVVIAFVVAAGGLGLSIAFLFVPAQDRADHQLRLIIAAALAWGMLGSLTVVAKLSQWRMRKEKQA